MARTWLIVGLGNPGPRYEATRHNVGQMVIDELADRRGETLRAHKAGARVAETWLRPGADKLILAKPNSFMNVSGGPVSSLAKFYGIDSERVVVVHDELDIPFDTMRVKLGGGDNGHNGLKSMRSSFGTGDFHRVRVGIGRPPGRQEVADFVLSDYSSAERKVLPFVVDTAADAVETLVAEGLEKTQQRFNS